MNRQTPSGNGTLMAELPEQERPRERLLRQGAAMLSVTELLALIIATGRRGESSLRVAERVLVRVGGLRELFDVDAAELQDVPGVGPVKAVSVLAAVELGRRLYTTGGSVLNKIASPQDAATYLMDRLRFLRKEHFVTLHLDTKHQIVGEEVVSVGSLNASIVHPREIFKTALKRSAAAVICAHNHPSGDPTPSEEDIQVTQRLVAAGRILGVEVLDHIVIGDKRYISLRERGFMTLDG